jgi:hypothetical protein
MSIYLAPKTITITQRVVMNVIIEIDNPINDGMATIEWAEENSERLIEAAIKEHTPVRGNVDGEADLTVWISKASYSDGVDVAEVEGHGELSVSCERCLEEEEEEGDYSINCHHHPLNNCG